MGRRRFVNLVVQGAGGLYSLRRIPANRLFYPSTRAAEEATAKSQESFMEEHGGRKHPGLHTMEMLEKLPRSTFAFEPAPVDRYHLRSLDFACLLGHESRMLTADNRGNTVVFDADSSSVLAFPNLISPKRYNAISLSIINNDGSNNNNGLEPPPEDGLYVMTRSPDVHRIKDGCFEVLNYSSSSADFREMTPHWVSLPPPPFAGCMNAEITSYTVVHGTTIYISCNKPIHSTYAFDTVSREWRRLGSWTMPFHGRAEYVPELNLWFGLSADHPYSLCAFDLPSDDSSVAAKPPTVQHTWVDLVIPQSWLPWNINLINLGCGRFCIAKMFHSISGDGTFCSYSESDDGTIEDSDPIHGSFAIFTGLHMVRPRGKHDDVQMIKHKFMYYQFFDDYIEWVI
ncbi:uncharacterized protein [Oryza sativa Japonica Group]|uniref:Uncharacterized protein n=2 Tax=Oryza sativa TaxID=4530 RepID=Q2RBF1_ORYSJ|nr:uncharacterized protein LOC107279318 [Oryza sativa Japonica Group]ABA91171.1 hypothetical protein LOC_Os11g02230 [Oryza sativa Japonica Group]EAY79702.1 hypothetical protein OsI_34851 [Oryza sativa Indica Group]KAF2909161.1 hypothetical protein DAI22_11g006400 [Oryza sativa Japonica Group]